MAVDYSRLAEPQATGYDNRFFLQAATKRWNYTKPTADSTLPTFLGVPVWDSGRTFSTELVPVRHDHLNVKAIARYMQMWPEAVRTFRDINDYVTFLNFTDNRYDGLGAMGCTCGNITPDMNNGKFSVYTTVFDPIGGAEGLVHETGHLRLHAIGLDLESHSHEYITNDPQELYVSPIRKDTKRPMSAVIQGEYSYINVAQLDLKIWEHEPERALPYIKINVARIIEGLDEIRRNVRVTRRGRAFMNGLYRWADAVIEHALAIIDKSA